MRPSTILYWLGFLAVCFAVIVRFEPLSITRIAPRGLVDIVVRSFVIDRMNCIQVVRLLSFLHYNYASHYESIVEEGERLWLLLYIAQFAVFHDALFSLPKMITNLAIANVLLDGNFEYKGNLLAFKKFDWSGKFFKEDHLVLSFLIRAKQSLPYMETIQPIMVALSRLDDVNKVLQIFEHYSECMTPKLMSLFIGLTINELCTGGICEDEIKQVILNYLSQKDLNDSEKVLRAVLIVEATNILQDASRSPQFSMLPLLEARKILYPFSTKRHDTSHIESLIHSNSYEVLLAMAEYRTDMTFWETIGSTLISQLKTKSSKRGERVEAFLKCARYIYFSPLQWKDVMQAISEFDANVSWPGVPNGYRPQLLLGLQDRLTMWLRDGPLIMSSYPVGLLKDSTIIRATTKTKLPCNRQYYMEDIDELVKFSDRIFERADGLLQKGDKLTDDEIKIIILSWVYLLLEGKRKNFGQFFAHNPSSWKDAFTCSKSMKRHLTQLRYAWKLDFFSLDELRSLVDSSFT